MIVQQSNLAMMLMGKTAHPQTGEAVQDLEAAKLFIDQLEMLQEKTKGNLNKNEDTMLKQTLMNLRLAFVEAVESAPEKSQPQAEPPKAASTSTPEPQAKPPEPEESHKKFTKKY
ncbi:MAG TPA: DUF1844 domain-containing protein [Candidatus Dormibacteraeota bacterium]|nr:DUF1844 domain-containing protein [Candidatus Dormibacteraeota bacterium]